MPVMDPFLDSSNSSLPDCAISLLPKTFMKNENTCEKWKQGDYPGVLQALAVNTSKDRLDQARIVLASNSELQNSGVPQSMQTTCEDRAIPPMVKNRERRPGLGFKHARFSLRPSTSSQSSLDVDKNFDIGKYPDAEDFFAAYEKHERAETELRKLRGEISIDSTQQELARKTRIRRPGLSGRIAHYKHYNYSSDVGDLNERFGSSQKTSEANGIMDLEITDKHGPSQEKGVAGGGRMDSVAEPKNKVDCLLDEILINDCTTLDRDGLSNLLEEQLQIRPMEKFDLPLLGRVRKSDDNISLEQLGRSMKLSSTTQNMTERVKDKGSIERRKLSINSTSPDSPTPSRSPLSSISLAARHFTLADRPDNTFSFTFGLDDISPVRDLTHVVGVEKGAPSPHIDSGSKLDEANRNGLSFSEKFEAMIQEKNLSDGNTVDKLVTEDSAHSVDAVDYNQSEICNDTNLKTCDVGLEDKVGDMQQVETMGTEKNPVINDKVVDKPVTENSAYSVDLVDDNNIEHMDHSGHGLEDKIEDMGQERMASDQAELETMKNTECLGTVGNVSGPSVDKDAPHVEASILSEPNNETHQERPRNVLNVQSKQKAPVHNKRQGHKDENKQKAPMRDKRKREVSYRKSLAGAGIQWQDGVRRSTRKRVRPLEFWKGEQFVYGRVHDSLVTVVGCKYASSPKGKAEPTLKFKIDKMRRLRESEKTQLVIMQSNGSLSLLVDLDQCSWDKKSYDGSFLSSGIIDGQHSLPFQGPMQM